MFNSSFGKLSLTKPAFYIPQPQHSLVDVIAHSYGIVPGQEPIFSTLLDYLLALNPTVKNPRMALGSQAPRTLDFISHDPDTILCMNPTVVKARIREVVNGGGEFALVDTARSFLPADPAERGDVGEVAEAVVDHQPVVDVRRPRAALLVVAEVQVLVAVVVDPDDVAGIIEGDFLDITNAAGEDLEAPAIRLAAEHGVAIGAHPGLRDPGQFGRAERTLAPQEVEALVNMRDLRFLLRQLNPSY